MTELSPDAQEIWTAFDDALEALDGYGGPLAAALRSAADNIGLTWSAVDAIAYLHELATELENQND
jgi:hypothetical protein